MNHWMFRCNDVSQKVSQSMDDDLPLHQRMAIWIHLLMCRYCLRFRNQMKQLRKLSRVAGHDPIKDIPPREKLSQEVRDHIKQQMNTAANTL